jgi:thermitase
VDSGVDASHPDLAPNMGEGHDWVDGDADPADLNGHGTHVAGTIGARGNDGAGVAGMAWRVSLVPLRVLDADGSGYVSDVIQAYGYARDRQLRVVNASLGGDSYSQAERDAIASAPHTLFVVAAGNDGADNDVSDSYPCDFDLANVLCVAAVDQHDRLADFSNRGAASVDLAAPGVNVASTWPGGDWALLDGTSMATPHVAGAAALVWSLLPGATVPEVREILLRTAEPEPSLLGLTVSGGRLNAAAALQEGAAIARGRGDRPAPDEGTTDTNPPPATSPSLSQQPAPTPAPVPGSAPDRSAPGLRVAAAARQRLRRALRRGLHIRVRCSEACTLRAVLRLPPPTARRLGLRGGGLVGGRGRGGTPRAGSTTLVVRPAARIGRRLARLPSVRAELIVRASDRRGNTRRALRRVLLVR